MHLQRGTNTVVFLLVREDHVTPVGEIDVSQLQVRYSFDGGGFVDYGGTVSPIGSGWFTLQIDVAEDKEGPFVLTATYPGSPEWRDIHDYVNLSGGISGAISRLEESLATLQTAVAQAVAGLNDGLSDIIELIEGLYERAVDPDFPDFPDLSTLRIVRIEEEPGAHTMYGVPVVSRMPDVSLGRVAETETEPTLGPELLPVGWGRYDNGGDSQVLSESEDHISIRYGAEGSNQQIWKVVPSLEAGTYRFEFDVESEDAYGSAPIEVHIRLHKSPYSTLGYIDTIESGSQVRQDVRLESSNGEPVRIQFKVDGLFVPPATYNISGLSLRRVL